MGASQPGHGMGFRPDPLIVIPTIHARDDLLNDCLWAIQQTSDAQACVVSGGSFAENCNRGAEEPGDPIVFLNDDTVPQQGWLDALLAPFADPRVGITGARLTYPDGRIQHAGVYFTRPGGVLTANNVLTDEPSRFVPAVTGACMAIRRDAWSGFDTQFVNGYEDIDLCLRAAADGWRIWYAADSHVVHHESQSGPARWTHVRQNIQRLQEQHGDHLSV